MPITTSTQTPQKLPILCGGQWIQSTAQRWGDVFNPSRGQKIAQVPMCDAEEVDRVVRAAAAALDGWADVPVVERARVMFKFRQICLDRANDLAKCLTREHGKTPAEAWASVQRGIEVLEFACGIPSLIMGRTLPNIVNNVDTETTRHPVGVCVGITPFNFPVMVPLWMFPIAIVCGNTFVLKPSEKVPLTAIRIVQLLEEAGLPKGVMNVVHGGRDCVEALLTNAKIKAVSFVGSTPVARHVFEVATRHGKRVQSNGGAKNYVFIMPDADVENSARGVIEAAYGCAGERCMAGSTALVIGEASQRVLPAIVEAARAIQVGPTDREAQPQMGPVITRQHRERVEQLIDSAAREGAKVAVDGRGARVADEPNGFFVGATILDEVQCGMTVAREEVFGPVLNVMRFEDLDAAIEMANRSPYGNGASIFTRSGKAAREFKHRIKAGMVGINIGVPASVAWFPFVGWDESFFGDLHIQGKEGVQFFTRQKVTTTRWFSYGEGDIWHR